METSNNNLTAERSLEIIAQTIEQSRRNITRGSWKSMLVWGVAVTAIALLVGHLWMHTALGPAANMAWALLGLLAIAEYVYNSRRPKRPDTFVGKTIGHVWASFGLMAGLLGLTLGIVAGFGLTFPAPALGNGIPTHNINVPITALIIFSMGGAGMATGRILNSKPITICCYAAGFGGTFLSLVWQGPYEMVALALASVIGLIVPALIIKHKEV